MNSRLDALWSPRRRLVELGDRLVAVAAEGAKRRAGTADLTETSVKTSVKERQ
jgi:hypothetical protein